VVADALRFYLDENVPTEVARQLRARGIEAMTARDARLLGALDEDHLTVAVTNDYVLCTYDADFLGLASEGRNHSGIVFGQQDVHYIGDWVNWLTLMHAVYNDDDMRNRIEYL
jgi:hypothetical protein